MYVCMYVCLHMYQCDVCHIMCDVCISITCNHCDLHMALPYIIMQMNTSVVHSSGALLLEPPNQLIFSVKTVNNKDPIPITFNTPQEKVAGTALILVYTGTYRKLPSLLSESEMIRTQNSVRFIFWLDNII